MSKIDAGKLTGKLPLFKPFEKLDGNKDGVLTGTEVKKKIAGFDADVDRKITKEEYDAGVKAAIDKAAEEAKADAAKAKEERIEKGFKKLDINKDGNLSGTEISKKVAKYDIDKDGKVSLPEYKAGLAADAQAAKEARRENLFDKLDGNKDGVLTGTEIGKKAAALDTDGDGKVSKDEFMAPVKAQAPIDGDGSGDGSGDGTGDGSGDGTTTPPPPASTEPPKTKGKFKTFNERDINKDGILSGNEAKGLTGYDGDGDKEITKDEFLAARNKENAAARDARREKLYGKADGNKDGALTGTELKGIEHYDTDKDGTVTKDEFKAGRKADWKAKIDKKAEDLFAKADGNKDGVLTGTETKKFGAYDADKDGTITKDEFKTGLAEDRKKHHEERILGK